MRAAALAAGKGMPTRKRGAAAAAAALARKERGLPRLESFSNLPDYLQDNEFIVNHYRPELTPMRSLRTLWALHNETGNVWTHLIGRRALRPLPVVEKIWSGRWGFAGQPFELALTHRIHPAPLSLNPDCPHNKQQQRQHPPQASSCLSRSRAGSRTTRPRRSP